MRRILIVTTFSCWLAAGAAAPVQAQWAYPGGFGGFGFNQWGSNPASGYMAGVGAFAKGKGAYVLDQAQANAINQQTVEKWNKALRARQRALREERAEDEAQRIAQYSVETKQLRIENGSTLNYLLDRILAADSLATQAGALKLPLAARTVRDIPFESESEAISLSLNQLTAFESWPPVLRGDRLAPQRRAVRDAVEAALGEDVKGEVSVASQDRLNKAIDALRRRFVDTSPELSPDFRAGDQFLKTLAGLSRLIHNEQFREVIARLENYDGGAIGDLIVFMYAFNLRFGPATTTRQRAIYNQLGTALTQALDQIRAAKQEVAAGIAVDTTGKDFAVAAQQAFQSMSWREFDDQAKPDNK